ncbi:hypothetical protein NQ315_002115 [Exocentrus adspersus]|uniref:Large ribosomal subunit protein mL52 n=1 Tax=Exocentrus adspersus TaxID=1586481 RepID=A0AAV8VYV4_9CUCU|nr:hypothetical protein NQ315_002115 [Exocentrus adspersus]
MIQQRILNRLGSSTLRLHIQSKYINTTTPLLLIQKWRKQRGLPLNPNATGVLTDAPDYTFLDGRLTPYGVRQKK